MHLTFLSKMLCLIAGLFFSGLTVCAQQSKTDKYKKASSKVERGFKNANRDTLAQGYFDLGLAYQQQGDLVRSERYYTLAVEHFQKLPDAQGVAKSSRALAKVQELLNKRKEAISNYRSAVTNSMKSGDNTSASLNRND